MIPLLWLLYPYSAAAQTTADLPLVGVLRLDTRESVKPVESIFRNTLASLGQVDGGLSTEGRLPRPDEEILGKILRCGHP